MIRRSLLFGALLSGASGCTSLVVNLVAGSLSGDSTAFASDDDPELVGDALPFALKSIESLLADSPESDELLLAAASGFTQYAYGFVLQRAEALADAQPSEARFQFERARRLFHRARLYGLRGLEAEYDDFAARLRSERTALLSELDEDDVPLLYWTAAAWAAEISLSKQDMERLAELPLVGALLDRALALDEAFDAGALHELAMVFEASRIGVAGGSRAKAQDHFQRSLELSGGEKIGVYVSWAETIDVQEQNRAEFDRYLQHALAFDVDASPRHRLANTIAQRKAARLEARASDLFL